MKRVSCIFAILCVMAVCMAFLAGSVCAQEKTMPLIADKVIVLFVKGEVMVETERAGKWIDAAVGMALQKGENLKTGAKSWAEIGVVSDRENIFRVQEKTLVSLIDLAPIRVGLLKGEVRSLVQGLSPDSTFQIETPTAICGARGTGWDTKTDGKKLTADAHENSIFIRPVSETGQTGKEYTLDEGKRGILKDPARDLVTKDIPLDRMRDWNGWKEDFAERRSGGAEDKKDAEARTQAAAGSGASQANTENTLGNIQEKVEQIEKTEKASEGAADTTKDSSSDRKDGDNVIDRTTPKNDSTCGT